MVAAEPMEGAFHFAVGVGHAASGVGIVFAVYLGHGAVLVFLAACTFHDVGVLQTHFLSRSHAEIFLRCVFHEVIAFHPQFAAEFDGMASGCRIFGVVDGFQFLNLSFGIVGDDQFHRVQYGRYTGGTGIQVFAYGAFEQGEVVECIVSGVTYFIDELTDGFGRIAATAESAESRHTGIVPVVHQSFLHQDQQVAFTHQRVVQVQFVELRLTGTVVVQVLAFFQPVDEQIVKRAVRHELECTE